MRKYRVIGCVCLGCPVLSLEPTRSVSAQPRPVYLNLLAIRQPVPAIVSILHRISGAVLFLIGIPALLWGVQATLASPEAFAQWKSAMAHPFAKLVALALAWSYIHHFLAGLRHLVLDVQVGVDLVPARRTAAIVLVLSLLLTLLVAMRLW
jgi:succinate dehydrogenase / fumarate reductase, cytochrome b subunit